MNMKTVISLLSTLTLITAMASLDASTVDFGFLLSALAVAGLFAFALNDSPRPAYATLPNQRVTRTPWATTTRINRRRSTLKLVA